MCKFKLHQDGVALLFWAVLAYVLCLIPSSCFDWIKQRLSIGGIDGAQSAGPSSDLFEWAAHAVLLAGVAFHLMRYRVRSLQSEIGNLKPETGNLMLGPGDHEQTTKDLDAEVPPTAVNQLRFLNCVGWNVLIVGAVALSIEGFQMLLPHSFHRGFAWDDIGFSLVGGFFGAVLGAMTVRTQ